MLAWQYKKWGACDFCADDDARLAAPRLETLRVVVPPLFCPRCRVRFQQLLDKLGDANVALKAMEREGALAPVH